MRKLLKWVGIIILIPVVLVLLLAASLYIPPIQNFVITKAVGYANSATGLDIGFQRIRIGFPLKVDVKGIRVMVPEADTLLTAGSLSAHLKILPLLKKEIEFRAFDLSTVTLNTDTLIDGTVVKGRFEKFDLNLDVIHLDQQQILINDIGLSDAFLTVEITSPRQEKDSVSTPSRWYVEADKIGLDRVSLDLSIPEDTLHLSGYLDELIIEGGKADLFTSRYNLDKFTVKRSSLTYDGNELPPAAGFDPEHIVLSGLDIDINDVEYKGRDMHATIGQLAFTERSGLKVTSLNGEVKSDSTTIEIPGLELKTPVSQLTLRASAPWSSFNKNPSGNMQAMLRGSVGKSDLVRFAGKLPQQVTNSYPETPLSVTLGVDGNMNMIHLRQLKATLPGSLDLTASGTIRQLQDNNRRSGTVKLSAETGNTSFLNGLLPPETSDRVRIPSGIRLSAELGLAGSDYRARFLMTESKGRINGDVRYDTNAVSYQVNLKIDSLQSNHFLPKDSLMRLTATIQAQGRGTDIYSPSTRVSLEGTIQDVQYASTRVHDIQFDGLLAQNQLHLDLESTDPNVTIDADLNAVIRKNSVAGTLALDAGHIDFQQLHLLKDTVATTFNLYAEGESDLKKDHTIDLTIGNWEIATPARTYRPKIVVLHANTDADTTRVSLHNGDLGIVMTGNADVNSMIGQFSAISREISTELRQDTMVYITRLEPLLPDLHIEATAGTDNIMYSYLMQQGIRYHDAFLNATTSPQTGLYLDAGVYSFNKDTLRIDTIQMVVRPDTAGLLFRAGIEKNRYRNQTPFSATVEGHLTDRYVDALLTYENENKQTGILLGVRANKAGDEINLKVFPDHPILAFRTFTVNTDNHILYRNKNDIEANLRLTDTSSNASIWVHSVPEQGTMQELHAELIQFDLDVLTEGFPQLPSMGGILNADVSYAPYDSSFQVVADMYVDTLVYEGGTVGEIRANAVYLPLGNGEQQVDVHMMRDGAEFLTATALYQTGTPDNIDGSIVVDHLPMAMISPFIPDDLASLSGAMNGDMTISGSTARPDINGYLQMDTAAIYITPANSTFRLDSGRIEVAESLISFNQYRIYSESNDPFTIDGTLDIGNIANIIADLSMTASNMELLDAPRTSESLVYGKLVIDLNTTIKGPVSELAIRGDVHLLGSTNVTYVMTESPLTVQDRMDGLVTFVNFADTFDINRDRQREVVPLGGMDILFVVRIDPVVQLNVDLTPDQSNRIDLIGGGDLTFQSNPEGIIVLNGTYTLSGGTVSYTLPVVPLKDFSIHDGSYVTWNGDPVNPTINITATERVRASVVSENDNSRLVNFDVGVVITGNLEDLSLNFTLDAPEDGQVQSELEAMGPEEESRQAVGMLITGRYLAGGGDGNMNFNMGSALNTFLQNEIGNLAGDALKTVDISFDMDTYDDNGQSRTDYSFKFAKRFYNDRIQVVIGGRVTTGSDISSSDQSFIDDVSIEYRLDDSGTRYVKLFHDTTYESLLEGEITETGIGLVLRKKMRYLRELFIFRKKKKEDTVVETPVNQQVTTTGNDE